MEDAIIAQKGPYEVELEPGEYYWCACGRSKEQPFCDGSHQGTGLLPLSMKVEEKGVFWLCGCKATWNAPHCDGSHKKLD